MEMPRSDSQQAPPPLPSTGTIGASKAPPPLPPQRSVGKAEKTEKPFLKALACGAVLYVAIVGMILLSEAQNVAYRCSYSLMSCLLATVVSGIWCYKDKQKWSWGRIIGTVVGIYGAVVFLQMQGSQQP